MRRKDMFTSLCKPIEMIVISGTESEPISEIQSLNLDLHGSEILNGFDQRFCLSPPLSPLGEATPSVLKGKSTPGTTSS
jgi:hypothetical protein